MSIVDRFKVRAAVERALALDPCVESALAAVAAALCLPIEAVRDAVRGGAAA